ncbi:MAG: orotidine 5'-phosphate decarboxylase / HUMPS family protein [bacterium]
MNAIRRVAKKSIQNKGLMFKVKPVSDNRGINIICGNLEEQMTKKINELIGENSEALKVLINSSATASATGIATTMGDRKIVATKINQGGSAMEVRRKTVRERVVLGTKKSSLLDKRKKYVQIALNGSANEALKIISILPSDLDRILIEAGTPLIKSAGIGIITDIKNHLLLQSNIGGFRHKPYIVADMKVSDLADREVVMARRAGASAITCLGVSPIETINNFIASCRKNKLDSMIDMMNVDNPILVLKQLEEQPDVVIVHRGVDETDIDKQKMIPYYQINQIKGNSESMVAVAGGDTIQEIRSAIFNNADIVVLWKAFVNPTKETVDIIKEFLKEIR